MSEYLLSTSGLTKQFGHHKAVNNVDLHVKKGAIYGFIGRNGAGKTTFLKMISGLSKPTDGEIQMFGYRNEELKNVRSRISCLIEAPGIYGNMSAYHNLAIKCRLFGINDSKYIENCGAFGSRKEENKAFFAWNETAVRDWAGACGRTGSSCSG